VAAPESAARSGNYTSCMSCVHFCRRVLLGIAFAFAWAASADDPIVDIGTARDFADVTADLTFQSATSAATDPDPALFRPVASNQHVFERYDGSYWFKLELVNGSSAPVRRLLELTHGRLGLIVARIQSGDERRELLRTGVGMKVATRAVSFPNAVIPFDVAPQGRATLLFYATSRDNMVLSARLWSEAGFSAYQLRHELVVGAGLGALLVLGIYNLVVFLITRGANYARLSALLIAIASWHVIAHGYADLVLWPDSPTLTARTLPSLEPAWARCWCSASTTSSCS